MKALTLSPQARRISLALLTGVLLALAYGATLRAPFVFDDRRAILDNPTIRQLWPLSGPLSPPTDGRAVSGRPLVNLSFALNHAWTGAAPWSYHLVNLALHGLSAALLFGLVRRTLATPLLQERYASSAWGLAWFVASLWALHPLQTESVTCIAQRTESLAGLFYLLTLYAFVRGADADGGSPTARRVWLAVSVGACLLGVLTKETVVTAPLIAWLYDRTFLAGSFRRAGRERRGYYSALASTWLLLAWLVLGAGGTRGTAAGFGAGMSAWSYLLQQTRAILLYLKLALWPDPLVVDYGSVVPGSLAEVWWQGLAVLGLLGATIWALVRRPLVGFLGAWFFVLLAPSSSFVPLAAQTMAEHRMYLPLAAVLILVTVTFRLPARGWSAMVAVGLLAVAAFLTSRRNAVYRSELSLWSDTAVHQPDNPRVQGNLGGALLTAGRVEEALTPLQRAARLQPNLPEPHANLGLAYLRLGRLPQAIAESEAAVELEPTSADARVNLARAYLRVHESAKARVQLDGALRLKPADAEAHYLVGNLAVAAEDFSTALASFQRAVELDPGYVAARNNLANVYLVGGQFAAAIREYEAVLRLRPDDRAVRENLERARELAAAPQ